MAHLSFTETAQRDLGDIWAFIAQDNLEAADQLILDIQEQCVTLSDMPEMGRERSGVAPGLRSFPIRHSYLIYYLPLNDGIEVVRVLHSARDVEALW